MRTRRLMPGHSTAGVNDRRRSARGAAVLPAAEKRRGGSPVLRTLLRSSFTPPLKDGGKSATRRAPGVFRGSGGQCFATSLLLRWQVIDPALHLFNAGHRSEPDKQ